MLLISILSFFQNVKISAISTTCQKIGGKFELTWLFNTSFDIRKNYEVDLDDSSRLLKITWKTQNNDFAGIEVKEKTSIKYNEFKRRKYKID